MRILPTHDGSWTVHRGAIAVITGLIQLLERGRQRAGDCPVAQDAVAALRANGIMVIPCGDEFQHWQMGDFIMTDADLVRFAVSRGLIAGD